MVLLDEPGVLRITYEPESSLQVHEWLDYDPEGKEHLVPKLLDRIYRLLIDHPAEKVLVKADRARGAFSPEVQELVREVQFPRLVEDTAVRFVATVVPTGKDLMETIGTELWREQLAAHEPLILNDVTSEEEAREWLELVARLAGAGGFVPGLGDPAAPC